MKTIIKIIGLILFVSVLFTGCDLFGSDEVSPADRLTNFASALNQSSRDSTYEHVHSSADKYESIKASTWWGETIFSSDFDSFSFTNVSIGSESGGIITATATFTSSSESSNVTITFKEEDSDVWYILSFNYGETSIIY